MQKEIKILESIHHPGVVNYLESIQSDKIIYIVMEHFKGIPLFDMITEKVETTGSFTEYEASKILKSILETIEYWHSKGIMHKDIKPKKILFNPEGQIKLVDFGFAKWESLSNFEMLSGTPFYLAPEVLKGVKNAKSDIWSIGVIMYALLSGHLPFVGDAEATVFHKAIEGKWSFDQAVWENVSNEAIDLIKKMICTNITKRYTAKQCLEHEWFKLKEGDDLGLQTITSDIVKNLKLIRSKTIMQNVAYKFVKKLLEKQDIGTLHDKLVLVAKGNEEIATADFRSIVSELNLDFTQVEIDKLIDDIIKTQENPAKINYVELLSELDSISEYNKDTKIWMTYNQYVDDVSGWMAHDSIKEALKKLNMDKTDEEIKNILFIHNINESEDVDFDQFKLIINHKGKQLD